MARHFITRLLVMFTLLASLGWATDMYLTDLAPDHATLTIDATSHQDDCPPGIDCHHCCHATAHLLTLLGTGLALHLTAGHHLNVAVDSPLHSFIPAPPYQPPRA